MAKVNRSDQLCDPWGGRVPILSAGLLIDGHDRPASSGATIERRHPAMDRGTIAAAATLDDADAAARSAAAAFSLWSASLPQQRARMLEGAAEGLVRRRDDLTTIMMIETGATRDWCHFNVEQAAAMFRQAARLAPAVPGGDEPVTATDGHSFTLRQPAGVCLAIAPWNAPIILGVRSFATALACGNSVILKSSELSPVTQRRLGDILLDAGLPPGVLNIISNAPADAATLVEALIAHPVVRRVNFTGSTRVGRMIGEMAARHLKRCLLALGGKAPLIVLEDADLDAAADAAAYGAFVNQGQICMSTERIIVVEAVADAFAARLADRALDFRAGLSDRGRTPLGALISREAGQRLAAMVEDALARGAQCRAGGEVWDAYMDATVIDHVRKGMRLYGEESFGPIASILRVADADEAITVANDCDYGLAGAIFSRDLPRALDLARRVESGILHINAATVGDDPSMPFGGLKASGHGRFGGSAALDEFSELRWVRIGAKRDGPSDRSRADQPWTPGL